MAHDQDYVRESTGHHRLSANTLKNNSASKPENKARVLGPVQTVLITGASRGIGRSLAVGLAQPGRTLILVASKVSRLNGTAGECEVKGSDVITIGCDFAKEKSVREMLSILRSTHEIDMIINCAGVFGEEKVPWEASPEDFDRTMQVNLSVPFRIQHALVPAMLERGGGRILDLSSGAAVVDNPHAPAYYVSKTALFRLAGALHEAGYERGLRVLSLAPGVVQTDMTAGIKAHADRSDWTPVELSVEITRAFADGKLDALSGKQVRAGTDSLEDLLRRAAAGSPAESKRLRLTGWE
ncbi:3-ketoacyl-ACP reductase [Actinobaculum suis]|uniref:3-ketoacyl-ACP reductase n=1 Tax=Actinobaculum suis TaxID=1657 RepID=A0A7Z8Y8U2_9ACTO|nr:SDR family NAD(P)-dependent oxidoreductase [Actinobaculum suis]VDG76412.1 3-ketoacyl-ACP reductase [Actinobaculum suis]